MEKTNSHWTTHGPSIKLIIIAALTLILLIPGAMLQSFIGDRETTRNAVIREINSKWGNDQTIIGPIISIPYYSYREQEGKIIKTLNHAHFLPQELTVEGNINPEKRYRSIYEVVVYNTKMQLSGRFNKIQSSTLNIPSQDMLWDQASIYVGISDLRGINEDIKLKLNDVSLDLGPGLPIKDIALAGVSSNIIIEPEEELSFSFSLNLNGSESLNFCPVGKVTNIQLQSPWSSPSFSGAFLPDQREVGQQGFKAQWKVFDLNRNFPQSWKNRSHSVNESLFGMDLLIGVDEYQKSERSVKYAIMFIALTFLLFFFSEIKGGKKFHLIQYFLVGAALIIFYSLLISISEHLGFKKAYLVSSIMVISLISLFFQSIAKTWKSTLQVFLLLCGLYSYLFIVVQQEDFALLMGSLGLFIVVAVVMFLSKGVDWTGQKVAPSENV